MLQCICVANVQVYIEDGPSLPVVSTAYVPQGVPIVCTTYLHARARLAIKCIIFKLVNIVKQNKKTCDFF